jgi:hypothetical protein
MTHTITAPCERCGARVELRAFTYDTHDDDDRIWRETQREGTCDCGAAVYLGCTWEVPRHD